MKNIALGDLFAGRVPSVNPAQFSDESFELWSIPAFDVGRPDVVLGSQIGSAKKCLQPGDVLLSRIVPHIRRAWIVGPKSGMRQIGSGEWIVFRGAQFAPEYLKHYLVSDEFHARFMSTVAGVGGSLMRARPEAVKQFDIPLPPLNEQRRIATILDHADALRRRRRDAITQVRLLKTSFLSNFVASAHSKRVRLAEVATKITDGTHQAPTWTASGVPFIFVSNIRNGSISFETEKFVSRETYNSLTKYSPIERGDVLYTAVGSYGHSAVVETDDPFLFQRHVAHIKPDRTAIRSEFLAPLLESPIIKRQADRAAKGIAQKTVTLADLKSFEIELPSLAEQDVFVDQSRKIDQIGQAAYHSLAHLDALFASLQHRAFRGEL